jgi:hypothetical protein
MDDKLNEPIDVGVGEYLYMTCGSRGSVRWRGLASERHHNSAFLASTSSFSHRLHFLEADVQQQRKSQFYDASGHLVLRGAR